MHVRSITQLWLTLCDTMDHSPPGFFVHGILQARMLEQVPSSGDLPDPGVKPLFLWQVDSLPLSQMRTPCTQCVCVCVCVASHIYMGFPGGTSGKEPACQCRRHKKRGSSPWIWVGSMGWEDPLEEATATHSQILAWKIPQTEEPGGLQSIVSQRVRHD